MGRRQKHGICKLCGEKKQLTFEHVPPRSALNNQSAKTIKDDQLLEHIGSEKKPWDVSCLWGKIQQQGVGGYFLCKECNAKTGAWYVPAFTEFVLGVYTAIKETGLPNDAKGVCIKAESIRPLPIFKEIMTMFCDINNNCFGDNKLRSYLLDKNMHEFNKTKYRVFCYINKGELFRMNGIMVEMLTSHAFGVMMIQISEISFFPLGFALYIDLPDGYKPKGCEITEFSCFNYEEEVPCEITLPILENNTLFSGDYRTKEEIEKAIEENHRWEKETGFD